MIIVFNWLIDPYNIYKTVNIIQITQKPLVTSHLRLAKAMAVEWQKPQTLILGSSTAETGIDPEYPAWGKNKAYNLGLSGANVYEVMRYLQHSQAIYPVKKIVLVVNFFMFNAYSKNRSDFNESILKVTANGTKNPLAINNIVSTLISFDALKASVYTLTHQNEKNAFKNNGQLIWNYRTEQVNKLHGYKNSFLNAEKFNQESLLPPPINQYAFIDPTQNINTIDYLQRIIKICEDNQIDLQIIIAPEHVRLLETYKLLGLWEKYEQWQIALAHIIDHHNQRQRSIPYHLWGFNQINQFTTESLPPKNDNTTIMKWFWDSFHFKTELGNLILQQILLPRPQNHINNFSTRLTSNNIQHAFLKTRFSLKKWEIRHTATVKELKNNLFTRKQHYQAHT